MDVQLAEHLALPAVAEFSSVDRGGRRVRGGEYPGIGCAAEDHSELMVMENLEVDQVRTLMRMVADGEPPEPRAPLTFGVADLSAVLLEKLLARAIADEDDKRSMTGGT